MIPDVCYKNPIRVKSDSIATGRRIKMRCTVFAVDYLASCTNVIEHERPLDNDVWISILINGHESTNFPERPATN